MKNLVSILIPTYNRFEFLQQAIQSCLEQTIKDIDIIVYDDGSIDKTPTIKNLYPNITYIKDSKNRGIGYARNILLQSFDTDYACWLDSDDTMNKFRIEYNLKQINNFDIIYSQFVFMNKLGKINNTIKTIDVNKYNKNDFQSLNNNTACATGFFKKDLKNIKFKEDIILGGEDVLWIYELLQKDYKFGYINEPLYNIRQHDDRIGIKKRLPEYKTMKDNENLKLNNYIENIKKNI